MGYYLMIKSIDQNGVKYLCKCMDNKNHIHYKGSGVFWRKILKSHPTYTISTKILGHYETKEELKKAGLYYSEFYNVVKDKTWANCIPESGDGGATVKGKIYGYNPLTRERRAFNNEKEFPIGWKRGNPPRDPRRVIHNIITGELKRISPSLPIPEGYASGGVIGKYKYGPPKKSKIYNNGKIKIYISPGNIVPNGFVKGQGYEGTTKNRIGCHNPVTLQKKYIKSKEDLPQGWVLGLLPTTGKSLKTPYGIFPSIKSCMCATNMGRALVKSKIRSDDNWYYLNKEEI